MIKTLSTLFLALICTFVGAQNHQLSIKVIDAANNEPITGASVRISSGGCSTNLEGGCTVNLPTGKHHIEVTFLGYDALQKEITLNANTNITLKLTETGNLLQQATVTAGRYEKPLSQVTVSLEVIKPKFLENNNAVSIDKGLDLVPGVSIIDGQANIRGGSGYSYGAGTRVLMLMDDMPALQADAGYPNWNDFPVENISQVEIVKGAASALYGSSAMNGIINLRTGFAKDKPEIQVSLFSGFTGHPADDNKRWWGRDSSELAQPYESGVSAMHRRKMGKIDIVASAFVLKAKSFQRATWRDYARFTPSVRYRVNERLTLGINTNFTYGKSSSFFIWAGDSTLVLQPGAGTLSESLGRTRNTIDPYLQYLDKYGNRHKLLNRYYFIRNKNIAGRSNSSDSWYSEYQFNRNFERTGIVLTAGAVGNFVGVSAELYGDTTYTIRTAAAYVQADKSVGNRLNLSLGLRYEHNLLKSPEVVQGITIPDGRTTEGRPVLRVGANYRVGKATYFRSSYGQGYRYPTIAEKFVVTSFGVGNSVEANPRLLSESGWSAELGVKQGFKVRDWYGFADAAIFTSEYKRMIEFVIDRISFVPGVGPVAVFNSKNVGDTRIRGYEIGVQGTGKIAGHSTTIMMGYTYLDPQYKVWDAIQKGNSSDTARNVLKYRFRHTFKTDAEVQFGKVRVGTNINYSSFMENIDAVFNLFLPGVNSFRQTHRTGNLLLDFRTGYHFSEQVQMLLIAKNVLNKEYMTRPGMLGEPRNFAVRLEWKM
jgi:outer membrane receptor protein involved in Fe transport